MYNQLCNRIVEYTNGKFILFDGKQTYDFDQNGTYFIGQQFDAYDNNIYQPLITKFVGILHLSSKSVIKNGINKVGMCRKDFTPFIKNLPKIMVKTKKMNTEPDEYVVVKFEKMEGNVMYCEVESYLGKPGNEVAELAMINALGVSHWLNKYNKQFGSLKEIDLTPSRLDLTSSHIEIYSIDPHGCDDIDDALHITKYDNYYEIGIHIADVSSFIEKDSIFDEELSKRVETIYFNHSKMKPNHMIPSVLSIDVISLKENRTSRAFSIFIKLDLEHNILNVEYKKTLIVIKKNLSYENAQNLINENISLNMLYNVGFILKNKLNYTLNKHQNYDIHQMVEVFMVLANNLVATQLKNNNPNNALFRVQKEMYNYINNDSCIKDNQDNQDNQYKNVLLTLVQKNEICSMSRAIYKIGDTDCKHHKLNLDYYTHFTSPMRRYADIIVHRQLYESLDQFKSLHDTINNSYNISPQKIFLLNFYSNFYGRVERYSHLCDVISNMNKTIETIAYVTFIKQNGNIRIHIPSLNIDYDYTIINNKIKHLFEYMDSNNDILTIKNLNTNNKIQLKLFQCIKIKISRVNKSMEKIHIILLDPNIDFNLDSV